MDARRKEILGMILAIALLPPVAALDHYAETHGAAATAASAPATAEFDADETCPLESANATATPTPSPNVAA